MKRKNKTCYICGVPATSREHVPPQLLFPGIGEVDDKDYRTNLITVPSCDEHNSAKSDDDEFLLIALASAIGNNGIAYQFTNTKIARALMLKAESYIEQIVKDSKSLVIETPEGYKFPVYLGKADLERFTRCFQQIVHGLYFHKFRHPFKGSMKVIPLFLSYQSEYYRTLSEIVLEGFAVEKLRMEIEGNNPEIFTYQFQAPDSFGMMAVMLTFYQRAKVFISLQAETVDLSNHPLKKLIENADEIIHVINRKEFSLEKPKNKADGRGR